MIPLGLGAADQRAFEAGLRTDHQLRVIVTVMTLDHEVVGIADCEVLSGQVDVDVYQQAKRSLQIEVMDPGNGLNLDPGTVADAPLLADRLVSVTYGVWSHSLPRWVDVPVFTGPITTALRTGDVVAITAHDKAALSSGPCSMNRTWPKGTRKTDVVKAMLGMVGERFLDIPTRPDKVTTPVTIASMDDIWKRSDELSFTFGDVRQLYDGRGYVVYRPRTSAVKWRFTGGEGGDLLTEPRFGYDLTQMRNLVVVHGGVPAGSKKRIQAQAEAPADHPLAPLRIGRGGVKRWLREDVEDEQVTSQAAANKLAQNTLDERLIVGVECNVETLVVPHLEPHDVVEVLHEGQVVRIPLGKYSIPLTADGRMTIGHHARTKRMTRERLPMGPRR